MVFSKVPAKPDQNVEYAPYAMKVASSPAATDGARTRACRADYMRRAGYGDVLDEPEEENESFLLEFDVTYAHEPALDAPVDRESANFWSRSTSRSGTSRRAPSPGRTSVPAPPRLGRFKLVGLPGFEVAQVAQVAQVARVARVAGCPGCPGCPGSRWLGSGFEVCSRFSCR